MTDQARIEVRHTPLGQQAPHEKPQPRHTRAGRRALDRALLRADKKLRRSLNRQAAQLIAEKNAGR